MTDVHARTGGVQLRVAGKGTLVAPACILEKVFYSQTAGLLALRASGGSVAASQRKREEGARWFPVPSCQSHCRSGGGPGVRTLLGELEPSRPDQ